ncbi:uncharacterized protein LOC124442945 [Xenia sp. Carnegie-2017]|uniref:uncharacterized protein LOC124442945 n=1 Tax=Xenia sp. Carnegie-2017 TaxID=2897299 RepID=UPI001F03CB7C|nr:uncharacterized protein LOC124442945 [Xenia sp. Carnegie-2017]
MMKLSLTYIVFELLKLTFELECHHYTQLEVNEHGKASLIQVKPTFSNVTKKQCNDDEKCSRLVVKDNLNNTDISIHEGQVSPEFGTITSRTCGDDERCSRVVLKDQKNMTYQSSDCLRVTHCENPKAFCKNLINLSNGTFVHCKVSCCNSTSCDENTKTNRTCYEYRSFTIRDKIAVKMPNEMFVNTCKNDELCSLGTFKDGKNMTHISLGCMARSVCQNPSTICNKLTHTSSPFVDCNVKCCLGDKCYSELIPTIVSRTDSATPTTGHATLTTGPAMSTTGPATSTTGPATSTTGPAMSTTGLATPTTSPAMSTTGSETPPTGLATPTTGSETPTTGHTVTSAAVCNIKYQVYIIFISLLWYYINLY